MNKDVSSSEDRVSNEVYRCVEGYRGEAKVKL